MATTQDGTAVSTVAAYDILRSTSWFGSMPPEWVHLLAAELRCQHVAQGHVFITEGTPIDTILILESGRLVRTKRPAGAATAADTDDSSSPAVVVDTVKGRGTVTGLLHNIHPTQQSLAFATVTADTDSTVWVLSGHDFRTILLEQSNPTILLEWMSVMAHELRSGSKSVRTLMRQLRAGSNHGEEDTHSDSGNELRVLCYDTTQWVEDAFRPAIEAFNAANKSSLTVTMDYTKERLGPQSATYAAGYEAVCTFVNDTADASTIQTLSRLGVGMIAQRAAGFDRIDTTAARAYGVTVARVPAYSPYAVAEMAIALLMAVNRQTAQATNRVKMANFTLDGGLLGFDVHGKTVGVMGTGKIGQILCNILLGFGVRLLCYDVFENKDVIAAGGTYVTRDEIFAQSDVLFFMMPLLPATQHTLNMDVLPKLKKGMIIINTSRGGLVDTKALLAGLQSGVIAGCGMDVYENEGQYFFQNWNGKTIEDPVLLALMGQPGVVMTAHQAFFTKEAVEKITQTTLENLQHFHMGKTLFDHPNNCIPKNTT